MVVKVGLSTIVRHKLKQTLVLGYDWLGTNWMDKVFSKAKVNVKNLEFIQKLVNTWKGLFKEA